MQGTFADQTIKNDTVVKDADRMLDSGRNNANIAHGEILLIAADRLFANTVIDIDHFEKSMVMDDCRTVSVMPQGNERNIAVLIEIKIVLKTRGDRVRDFRYEKVLFIDHLHVQLREKFL